MKLPLERLVVLISILAVVAVTSSLEAADLPRLGISSMDASRRPSLVLSGVNSGTWRIEASTNLLHWFNLVEGTPNQSEVRFTHQDAPNFKTLYYRGALKISSPGPAIQVSPRVDTNAVAVALITPEKGGRMELTNSAGVRYHFTVGPSNVTQAVAVRMRLITNFTSFPSASPQSAVMFDPDGYTFAGTGLLSITYPTNIPFRKVTSYVFQGDGSGFHMAPDLVSTNSVKILVAHFSGVGTGLWQPSERTASTQQDIQNLADRIAGETATKIWEARDHTPVNGDGSGEDSSAVADAIDGGTKQLYDKAVAPYLELAKTDCALAKTLTQQILSIERQRAMFDHLGPVAPPLLASDHYQAWECNCLKEVMEACKKGTITAKTFAQAWLELEQQSQLLGGGDLAARCGLGSISDLLKNLDSLPCTSAWIGTANYRGEGSLEKPIENGSTTGSLGRRAGQGFSGSADEAVLKEDYQVFDVSTFKLVQHQRWQVALTGPSTGFYDSHHVQSGSVPPCGTFTDQGSEKGFGNGEGKVQIEFVFDGNILKSFNITPARGNSLKFSTTAQATLTFSYDNCVPEREEMTIPSHEEKPIAMEPLSPDFSKIVFTQKTPLAIAGSITQTKEGIDNIPFEFTWSFSLRRKGN